MPVRDCVLVVRGVGYFVQKRIVRFHGTHQVERFRNPNGDTKSGCVHPSDRDTVYVQEQGTAKQICLFEELGRTVLIPFSPWEVNFSPAKAPVQSNVVTQSPSGMCMVVLLS